MNPARSPPGVLHTPGFAHYNIAWSPFRPGRIAIASAANYGLVGNGRLHLASITPGPSGVPNISLDRLCVLLLYLGYNTLTYFDPELAEYSYETQDGLYDVAWSEIHENQLVSASGDGSIKLWDIMLNVRPASLRSAVKHTQNWLGKDV